MRLCVLLLLTAKRLTSPSVANAPHCPPNFSISTECIRTERRLTRSVFKHTVGVSGRVACLPRSHIRPRELSRNLMYENEGILTQPRCQTLTLLRSRPLCSSEYSVRGSVIAVRVRLNEQSEDYRNQRSFAPGSYSFSAHNPYADPYLTGGGESRSSSAPRAERPDIWVEVFN